MVNYCDEDDEKKTINLFNIWVNFVLTNDLGKSMAILQHIGMHKWQLLY